MKVRLHPHAETRLTERGITENEVVETVTQGESFPAKYGRTGFRRNFPCSSLWRGKSYMSKQVEVFAVEDQGWLVLTAIAKYF